MKNKKFARKLAKVIIVALAMMAFWIPFVTFVVTRDRFIGLASLVATMAIMYVLYIMYKWIDEVDH